MTGKTAVAPSRARRLDGGPTAAGLAHGLDLKPVEVEPCKCGSHLEILLISQTAESAPYGDLPG
jgi:hypothetical protein